MSEHPVVFECSGSQLLGIIHQPGERRSHVGILVIVGGPQYRAGSHRQFTLMARSLATAGFPVMRFDYRGMGDSGGEVRTFESVHQDIRAALDCFMHSVPELEGVVLWGLCDGASASLMYCERDARVRGLILANPWVRTETGEARAYLRHYYLQRVMQPAFWRKLLTGRVEALGSMRDLLRKWGTARSDTEGGTTKLGFIQRMYHGMERFAGPTLLLISDKDLTAREFMDLCNNEEHWRREIRRPKVHLFEVHGADHTFSSAAALELVAVQTSAWLAARVRTSDHRQ